MRMTAEERAGFIRKKLQERWPGISGCDDLECLIDEPELLFAIVKFGMDTATQDKFDFMLDRIVALEESVLELSQDIQELHEFKKLTIKNMESDGKRISDVIVDNKIQDALIQDLRLKLMFHVKHPQGLFSRFWNLIRPRKEKSDGE